MSRAKLRPGFRVLKYTDAAYQAGGDPYAVVERRNTVLDAGLELFLSLGAGLSADHLGSTTDLRIYDSTPTLEDTLTNCDAGYPKNSDDAAVSEGDVLWQWTDATASTYTATRLDVVSPGGTTFSQATLLLGAKSASDTWIFQYTVSISAGGDADFDATGLDYWLHLMTGNASTHWDGTNTLAKLYTAARSQVGLAESPSAGPSLDSGANELTWEYTWTASEGNVDWGTHEMDVVGAEILRSGGTGVTGTKASPQVWLWLYTFGVS